MNSEEQAKQIMDAMNATLSGNKKLIHLLAETESQRVVKFIGDGFPKDFDPQFKQSLLTAMRELFIAGADFGFDETIFLFTEEELQKQVTNQIKEHYERTKSGSSEVGKSSQESTGQPIIEQDEESEKGSSS
jgi:hypothetical protein